MKMFNISKVQKTIPWIESSSALFVLCLLFFLLFFPHDSARAESLRLEDLVQISLNRHPSLQALRSQKNAQKQRVVQAGAYANPMLQLGVMNLPEGRWKFGEDMMTARSVGIMQRVHFPGRLTLQREQAGEKLEQLLARIEELELKLTNRVEKTYFDLWYNRRALSVWSARHCNRSSSSGPGVFYL